MPCLWLDRVAQEEIDGLLTQGTAHLAIQANTPTQTRTDRPPARFAAPVTTLVAPDRLTAIPHVQQVNTAAQEHPVARTVGQDPTRLQLRGAVPVAMGVLTVRGGPHHVPTASLVRTAAAPLEVALHAHLARISQPIVQLRASRVVSVKSPEPLV